MPRLPSPPEVQLQVARTMNLQACIVTCYETGQNKIVVTHGYVDVLIVRAHELHHGRIDLQIG